MLGINIGGTFVGIALILLASLALLQAYFNIRTTDKFSTFVGMSPERQRGKFVLIGILGLSTGIAVILASLKIL